MAGMSLGWSKVSSAARMAASTAATKIQEAKIKENVALAVTKVKETSVQGIAAVSTLVRDQSGGQAQGEANSGLQSDHATDSAGDGAGEWGGFDSGDQQQQQVDQQQQDSDPQTSEPPRTRQTQASSAPAQPSTTTAVVDTVGRVTSSLASAGFFFGTPTYSESVVL
eukprot:TRINITY_DN3542_c0_g1_i10.p2 TRINITY_DN3542_c0_g1~~TRINITY_DN3542_c0_g1_i10.p2  ORF type:complete len:167 (-),score=41.62 TRINITY_DN3542_c0_g1_i10:682-1182(-)